MSNIQKRGSYTPRRAREAKAYRSLVTGTGAGLVTVVSGLLAVVGVITWLLPIVALIVTVLCIMAFRRTVS